MTQTPCIQCPACTFGVGPECQLSRFLAALVTGALPMSVLGQPGETPYPFISHPLDQGWDGGGPAREPGWMRKWLLAAYLVVFMLATLSTYHVPDTPCRPFAWPLRLVKLPA